MQIPGTSENRQENERQDKGNHPKEQRVGKWIPETEISRVCQRMDKLLQACRHERADERNRWMAAEEDTGNILETVEEGKDKVSKSEGVETGRMASASASKQPERLLEDSADFKRGIDK